MGRVDPLQPLATAQIGMHHVALDGTGPHDGDLHNQIVKGPGFEARQHRHLRATLDLEGAERVGLPDHRIGARVLGRDGCEIEMDALRSEEHTSELQSLMRISYAGFCLKKKKTK